MGAGRGLCALALLIVSAALLGGCGDDSSTADDIAAKERIFPNVTGPTREFLVPEGDNIVQLSGTEGTEAEREQASRVIAAWMRARLASNWAEDCKHLSSAYKTNLVKDAYAVSGEKVKTCPGALDYFGEQASGELIDNYDGEVDSLRVEGKGAYAQYHGTDGKDWIVPLEREGGVWMVTIAAPLDRFK